MDPIRTPPTPHPHHSSTLQTGAPDPWCILSGVVPSVPRNKCFLLCSDPTPVWNDKNLLDLCRCDTGPGWSSTSGNSSFFLSVSLPARPSSLLKSASSAPADAQICVGSLQARQLTLPPLCPHRRHRPRRRRFVMDQSIVWVFFFFFYHKDFFPEELNPIDAKSNFAPEILNLMHAKLNLDMGSVSSLAHLADLYIFICRGRGRAEHACCGPQ